jgi:hypothetical protein
VAFGKPVRINLALDCATAMRGNLPGAGASFACEVARAMVYASSEMQIYPTPRDEQVALAEVGPPPLSTSYP